MRSAPSAAFRRFCCALALLATSWSVPRASHADAYPLQTVKTIADTLKPNVLIVLETAESMQDLPGENAARYNEVGADCEDGGRQCRLVGQDGRWNFSGMGKNGMYFGVAPSSCTQSETYTYQDTRTKVATTTNTQTTTQTMSGQQTATGSNSATATATGTGTATGSNTAAGSGTGNVSGTVTASWTVTATATPSATSTRTAYVTVSVTSTATGTATTTMSVTSNTTGVVTLTKNGVATGTVTQTGNVTASKSQTASKTATGTATATGTVTRTAAVSATATVTVSATATATGTPTTTRTVTVSATGTIVGSTTVQATATQTASATLSTTKTTTASLPATGTATLAGTVSVTATVTGSTTVTETGAQSSNATASATATSTTAATANSSGVGTANGYGAYFTVTGWATSTNSWYINYIPSKASPRTISGTGTGTDTVTNFTELPGSGSVVLNTTGTATVNYSGTNYTVTRAVNATCYGSGTAPSTGTAFVAANSSNGSGTHTASGTCSGGTNSDVTFSTGTGSASATLTGTTIVTGTGTVCVTATVSTTGSGTATATGTVSGVSTVTASGVATGSVTASATGTVTLTGTVTATPTATASATFSASVQGTQYATAVDTESYTATATHTISSCGFQGSVDPGRCDSAPSTPTTTGYCNESGGDTCHSDAECVSVRGDFCRAISASDGSGRARAETCIAPAGTPWGSCKHGIVSANTTCTSWTDSSCNSALAGDFCAEGQPAKMCSDSGLWCKDNSDCPGSASTDKCVAATSRMMTVKRALRRALTEYSDKVNFGFMNTYQGRGIPGTGTDTSTGIFPYEKVSCSGLSTITETKLLTRGELEKANCFSLASGPSSSCTIDYGGAGAITGTATLNQIAYTLLSTNNSRWAIPRSDGSGKSNHADASWSACPGTTRVVLPDCDLGSQGTGLYEGSYYTFSYSQGTPVASGAGSLATPVYFPTYVGKFYNNGSACYNAIDAQRTDIVNDGIYGRKPYTLVSPATSPYTVTTTGTSTSTAIVADTSKEASVPVPWGGATNASACGPTTGAKWNSNVVPFLNATVSQTSTSTSTNTNTATFPFNTTTITPAQKILMTTARLEKASFGGVYAGGYDDGVVDTGRLAPIGCALGDAGTYMSTVQSNDSTNNGGTSTSPKPPCWTNNIVLVVDGQSNGPGDMDTTGTIDCASSACAYSTSNPTLAGCNCSAITRAKTLASSGVQTYVVVNAPGTWSVRYQYTYAFLWNLALAGSNGLTTASFGTTEDEVYKAVSDKIAAAAYKYEYTTTSSVAGATTQDPTSLVLTNSNFLYDTSVDYPSWKSNLRAFDTTSTVDLKWDALKTAATGHPTDWTQRRIYFQKKTSNDVAKVVIDSAGNITNASDLKTAGLGATNDEAQAIMQWLLGMPGRGNPAPLMGSISSSTPIVVGQGASNGLNGSSDYSKNTWKRPQLVYVGADDGMLHTFFAGAGDIYLGGQHYFGGEEAFAFIPNDMLPVITKLWAQGGQKISVDKSDHIFGLAASPKVKDMCIGSSCATSTGSDWHTILVMTEGPGGNKPFALDITNVVDEVSGLQLNNLSLQWSALSSSDKTTYDYRLGETTSLPAFYFDGYSGGSPKNRAIFASGYPLQSRVSPYDKQGLSILNVDATNGQVIAAKDVTALGDTSCTGIGTRALLADVTVARDYSSTSTSQNLMAAYVVDTYGNTFQYLPSGDPKVLYQLGCGQPLYFAPAVVQLDRAPKADTSSKHQIYLVQVTNSNLDPVTMNNASLYAQLVVTKLDGNVSPPTIVASYNPLNAHGQIVLTTDPHASDPTTQICLQSVNVGTGSTDSFADSTKKKTQTCVDAGGTLLPSTARPVATPTVVLRSDGLGFQVITSWYNPPMVNDCSSGKQFNYGTSYITVHEFGADGTWYQIAGIALTDTVLTGVAFAGVGLFVDGINTASAPQSINIGETFSTMQQIINNAARERYSRTSWSERVDL